MQHRLASYKAARNALQEIYQTAGPRGLDVVYEDNVAKGISPSETIRGLLLTVKNCKDTQLRQAVEQWAREKTYSIITHLNLIQKKSSSEIPAPEKKSSTPLSTEPVNEAKPVVDPQKKKEQNQKKREQRNRAQANRAEQVTNNDVFVENVLPQPALDEKSSQQTTVPLQKWVLEKSVLVTESQQPNVLGIPEEKLAGEDPWEPLRVIYNTVYRKTEKTSVELLTPQIKALKNRERDNEFWKIIRMGFMGGKSSLFFEALQEYGAWQTFFPPTSDESLLKQQVNDAWFIQRLQRMDGTNESFLRNKYSKPMYHIDYPKVLLLVKELSSLKPDEIEGIKKIERIKEIEMIKQAYQITFTLPGVEKLIPLIAARPENPVAIDEETGIAYIGNIERNQEKGNIKNLR